MGLEGDQQYIAVSAAYPTYPGSNQEHQLRHESTISSLD